MEPYTRQHTVYPDEFPESWASGWGEDEFGLWMAFTYKGVSQKFRWCEPGTFWMGSPEDELERQANGADETQHEVTINKGFWIADTTVTQALWEAVMGENLSVFKGENRPVEKVSWEEAQKFISKLNTMKPELRLQLPTEEQWEYSCRAGSSTPFCWGEIINSELVNFRGTVPYSHGDKSEYRRETVDVESFYQNDWGLWQMHGNVWEWCQNSYESFSTETAIEFLGVQDMRVLRGGSWISHGRDCRSAYREVTDSHIVDFVGDFGLRLCRD